MSRKLQLAYAITYAAALVVVILDLLWWRPG